MLLILALRGGSQSRTSAKSSSSFLGKTRDDEVIGVKIKQRNTLFFSGFSQTHQQTEKGPLSEWLGRHAFLRPWPGGCAQGSGFSPCPGLWPLGQWDVILGQHPGGGCTNMQPQISFP